MISQNLSEKQIIITIQGIMYIENQTVIIETDGETANLSELLEDMSGKNIKLVVSSKEVKDLGGVPSDTD